MLKTRQEDKIIIEEESNPVLNDYNKINRRINSKGNELDTINIKKESNPVLNRAHSAKPEQRSRTPVVISDRIKSQNNQLNQINNNNYMNIKPKINDIGYNQNNHNLQGNNR